MHGRLKARQLASATLPNSWPKPVFAFKGSVGHLPVEAQPYVFVSRFDAKTGNHKVVPEMLYPIQANRQPVPKHQVLEDEYRAFHSVVVNSAALRRKYVPDKADSSTSMAFHTPLVDINSVLLSGRIGEVRQELPYLLAYNAGVSPPPGYIYRRYKRHDGLPSLTHLRGTRLEKLGCPPVVAIRGPFQNVVSKCPPHFCEPIKPFDSAVIGSEPKTREVRIYNEPDAVSTLAVRANFGIPLSSRARPERKTSKKVSTKGPFLPS